MRHIHFAATDSTNSQARLLAAAHPGESLLVTAAEQTAGRGRQGRSWQSPPGGAWMSVVWPLRKAASEYAAASLVAAIAVRRAVCDVAPELAAQLKIKWPNDLLLADRKVAGVLCELTGGESPAAGALVVGVGVNVDVDLAQLGDGLRHPPTTLRAELACDIAVDAVIDAVALRVAEGLAHFEVAGLDDALLSELRGHLAYVGSIRTWEGPGGSVTGRVLGIDDAGRLRLAGPEGDVVCATGEIVAEA